MTGVSPAKRFLGRNLRNTLSLLNEVEPTSHKRSSVTEYALRKSTKCHSFNPGDFVYFRKGRGPFVFSGKILKQTSPYTYLLFDLRCKQQRLYNVRDLKRKFDQDIVEDDAFEAYEHASAQHSQIMHQHAHTQSPHHSRRYSLRQSSVPLSIYIFDAKCRLVASICEHTLAEQNRGTGQS